MGFVTFFFPTSGGIVGNSFLGDPGIKESDTHVMLTKSHKKHTDTKNDKEIFVTASMLFPPLKVQGSCK